MLRSTSGRSAGSNASARAAWPDRARRRGTLGFGFRQRPRTFDEQTAGRSLFASPVFYAGLLASLLVWAAIIALLI